MKVCLAIPIFDHGEFIGDVVDSLAAFELPCIVVDDGSGAATRSELDRLEAQYDWLEVVRHDRNRGRGAALRTAYRRAAQRAMTHVIQLDADGQHCAADVPKFVDEARKHPGALILGSPIFDESIPWHRLHGRKLSQAIVWIETASRSVRDPLCGFRCIPLAETLAILEHADGGDRMDFDPELVIRLVRAGLPVVNIPTAVQYPEGGTSHFRMVEDNLRIAWAYIRLAGIALATLGTAKRLSPVSPRTLSQPASPDRDSHPDSHPDPQPEWASISERGSRFVWRLVIWVVQNLGGAPLRPLLAPVAAYYTLFSPRARRGSQAYLARLDRARGGPGRRPTLGESYKHFYSFAEVILDRVNLWSSADHGYEIVLHGRETMATQLETGRGALLIGAHLGSFDLLRVVARQMEIPVNVMMYSANAERINDAFQALDPECNVRIIDIDPTSSRSAFEIRRCVDRGEFVAVLADRVLPGGRHAGVRANFLGETAEFPESPFLLAMVLRLPVLMTIALKTGPKRYDVYLEALANGDPVPARERKKVAQERVETFAKRLEHYCQRAPLQWFNFYDFWAGAKRGRD